MNILSFDKVEKFCDDLRKSGKKIVFTNGWFDILHLGHIRYLKQARDLGDYLFLGLNSDSSTRALKGPERPVQSEGDRAEILSSLRTVDAVCVFSEATPLELIKKVKPLILVKGGDWSPEKIVGKAEVEAWGGKVLSLSFIEGHSTTSILAKIKKL
jgi:rfaE bifunctional protein nucleotidyltransferase chain/domain